MDIEDTMDVGQSSSRKTLKQTASGIGADDAESGGGPSLQRKRHIDVVEQCARAYAANPRPRRLGKMLAFWYNKKNEPWIVVGPDFGFSLLEMGLVNGIVGSILAKALSNEQWFLFYTGLVILILHDLAFSTTVLYNQGLPPRNPNAHSQGYLNKVKIVE